jgi:aspartyl-tRNA(Asn)/glutamyl-tRNA(Gln) amidotransferase subunit C
MISPEELKHLAELARIEVPAEESEKLRADLDRIVGYVAELQNVDTESVSPVTGGTTEVNVMRGDDSNLTQLQGDSAREAFPEKKDGYLAVPPVFSGEGGE